MSSSGVEYRFPMPGAIEGSDWLLRHDGRVVELFNLYSGGSSRFPFPETRVVKTEPNKKGLVTYKFRSNTDNGIIDVEVGPDHVAGMDDFLAKVSS